MRNRTLLIIGFVCLVIGLTPGVPLPIIFVVYLANAGGALIILATLRFLLSLVLGWPIADAVTVVLGIAQYFVVTAYELHAAATTPIFRRILLSWSEAVAMCAVALMVIFSVSWFRSTMWPKWQPK
jgi:hypothetical protein